MPVEFVPDLQQKFRTSRTLYSTLSTHTQIIYTCIYIVVYQNFLEISYISQVRTNSGKLKKKNYNILQM